MIISLAPYFADKGEHTALYKNYKNVYINGSKIIYSHNIVFLERTHACTHALIHTHVHTPTHTHTTHF